MAHPASVVVVVEHGAERAYLRVGPEQQEVCLVGVRGAGATVLGFTDFDDDGVADFIEARTCQFCDSNHVFVRGVR